MKKGRKKDHIWRLVKYKGDISIYAKCSCGFHYSCSKFEDPENGNLRTVINENKIYPYCPICGSRKIWYTDEVKKIDKYSFEV